MFLLGLILTEMGVIYARTENYALLIKPCLAQWGFGFSQSLDLTA